MSGVINLRSHPTMPGKINKKIKVAFNDSPIIMGDHKDLSRYCTTKADDDLKESRYRDRTGKFSHSNLPKFRTILVAHRVQNFLSRTLPLWKI